MLPYQDFVLVDVNLKDQAIGKKQNVLIHVRAKEMKEDSEEVIYTIGNYE